VVADPGEVDNALLNLVINSRDAMPRGGSLKIETHDVTLDTSTAAGIPDAHAGEFVCFSVSDTGHGMAPDVLRRAVEPFFTTKEPSKGTGFGLSSVYGFVRQSGGFLNITSEVGKGTSVSIFLPHAA
jgi:signal transduction histidine kinase